MPAQGATVTHLAQIAEQTITVVTIVAIVAAVMLAFFITRSIIAPLGFAVSATEAARAGEVCALAQRSATAAKEIKALITAAVSKVEDGAQLASEAGRQCLR